MALGSRWLVIDQPLDSMVTFDKLELLTGISHPITFTTPGRVAESTLWNRPSEQVIALLKMIKSKGG